VIELDVMTWKEILVTLIYITVITLILPSLKYVARTSKLFSVLLIFFKGKELEKHDLFNNISMIHSVNIPSRISSVGKKLLFTDILRIEMEHTRLMLKDYISKKSRLYIKNPIKRLYNLLISYEEFERMNVAIEVTSILDNCNSMVGSMIIIDTYPEIGVKQRDIINYIKNNRETLEVDEMDVESIRQNIQIGKARLIVSKFEEMMLPYRNQLSANMITQLTSDKNLYQLLQDILNNSILPVYMNIRDTIDIPINEINGDLDGIIYKENVI